MILLFIFAFSLYPWALLQDMPTGPGVHWDSTDKEGNQREFFVKKPLTAGVSMAEIRYLNFLMHHDERFQDGNGLPYIMEHSYNRGQKLIEGLKVDGYCETPDKTYLIEYNG